MPLGIDISKYNYLTDKQWDVLGNVLDVVTIRLGYGVTKDSLALYNINQAKRVGLPWNGYFWSDPTWPIDRQITLIREMDLTYAPKSIIVDYEQYWRDWEAYMRQDLAAAYATRFTPAELAKFYRNYWEALKARQFTVPLGIYSADWFISKYCPDLAWVKNENYLEARYFRYYDASWWAAKKQELGVPFDVVNMPEIAKYARITQGIGRQFESLVPTYGMLNGERVDIPDHLDWDVWADMRMFGGPVVEVPPPPVVEPQDLGYVYVVTGRRGANVRNLPSVSTGKVVASLAYGTQVIVWDIVTNSVGEKWAKIDGGNYVYLPLLSVNGMAYKITAAFLWVRATPGGKISGYKVKGDIVTIMGEDNGWGLMFGGGWIYLVYAVKM